jgi:hypothetical protein
MATQKFEIDLGPLKLPDAAVNSIEAAIQRAVLLELAQVDTAPSYAVSMSRPKGVKVDSPLFPFPQGTRGIVFVDPATFGGGSD